MVRPGRKDLVTTLVPDSAIAASTGGERIVFRCPGSTLQ
jgi:hypothetical protein